MNAMIAAAVAGFALGAAWLGLIGLPFFVPSYLDLAVEYRAAAKAAEAQEARGDAIEALRGDEADAGRDDVEAERGSCEARLRQRDALWSARLAERPPREQDDDEGAVCGDFRPLRDSLRDAGVVDG